MADIKLIAKRLSALERRFFVIHSQAGILGKHKMQTFWRYLALA
jgi:hypothetical protein